MKYKNCPNKNRIVVKRLTLALVLSFIVTASLFNTCSASESIWEGEMTMKLTKKETGEVLGSAGPALFSDTSPDVSLEMSVNITHLSPGWFAILGIIKTVRKIVVGAY